MSRRYETKIQPEKEYESCEEIVCDRCKAVAPSPWQSNDYGSGPWAQGSYDVLRVSVKIEVGDAYPEGSWGTTRAYDVCPECFTQWLEPVLADQGFTPLERNWDY